MASNTPASVAAATMITAYSAVMAPDSGLASTTPIRARRALAAESIAWLMRTYKAVMNRLERCLILCSHQDPAPAAGHVSVGTNCPPACLVCRWKTVATSCEYVIVLTFAFPCLPRPGEWPFLRGIDIRYLSLCPFRSFSVALSDTCGRVDLHRQPVYNSVSMDSMPSGNPAYEGRNAGDDSDQHEGRQNAQSGRHQQPDGYRRCGPGQHAAGMVIQLAQGRLDTRQRR